MKRSIIILLTGILLLTGFVFTTKAHANTCLLIRKQAYTGKQERAPWTMEITKEGKPLENNRMVFGFEVFINNTMEESLELKPSEINGMLKKYRNSLNPADQLKLIMLNPSHNNYYVLRENNYVPTDNEEIVFSFDPWVATHHILETVAPEVQYADYYFFYVEKSGGISNLRHISNIINEVAVAEKPFLVYFNALGRAMVVQDASDITRLYNELFTAMTQPPNPSLELEGVISVLRPFLPVHQQAFHLHLFFYFSEISYNYLKNNFLNPLLEERIPFWVSGDMNVHICTDFDINDQHPKYNYINILKTQ